MAKYNWSVLERIVNNSSTNEIKNWEEQTYKVMAKYQDGEKDITEKVKMVVENEGIAKLNSGNKITANRAGVTGIRAEYGDMTGWGTIEVEKH